MYNYQGLHPFIRKVRDLHQSYDEDVCHKLAYGINRVSDTVFRSKSEPHLNQIYFIWSRI